MGAGIGGVTDLHAGRLSHKRPVIMSQRATQIGNGISRASVVVAVRGLCAVHCAGSVAVRNILSP